MPTSHRINSARFTFVPYDAKSMVQDFVVMSDRVRWAGQPVAAVAATTEEIAEAALQLIDVEYEELPTVFDPEAAMRGRRAATA